jgi:endonuclease YncB( thermonuclease family)
VKDRFVMLVICGMVLLLWTGTSVTSLAGVATRGLRAIEPHMHLPSRMQASKSLGPATVEHVIAGDQIRLTDGRVVHLAQIDVPGRGQCGSGAATRSLARMLPPGSPVELQSEPAAASPDAQDRTVAYVVITRAGRAINLSMALVEAGFAAPALPAGQSGQYDPQLLRTAQRSRSAKRGLWSACKGIATRAAAQ